MYYRKILIYSSDDLSSLRTFWIFQKLRGNLVSCKTSYSVHNPIFFNLKKNQYSWRIVKLTKTQLLKYLPFGLTELHTMLPIPSCKVPYLSFLQQVAKLGQCPNLLFQNNDSRTDYLCGAKISEAIRLCWGKGRARHHTVLINNNSRFT